MGFCAVLVSFFVSFYYNVIIGWAFHFLASSLNYKLPWKVKGREREREREREKERERGRGGEREKVRERERDGKSCGRILWSLYYA